jgi:hypothetical protein
MGKATVRASTGRPIVTTAKIAGLAPPKNTVGIITNSAATTAINLAFIGVLILLPYPWRQITMVVSAR